MGMGVSEKRETDMPINTVIHTNRHSIDRVINAGVPTALVFWEKARPLSSSLEAELDRLAAHYAGKALIAKIDARDEPDLLRRFGVSQAPAVVYLRDGQILERTQANDPAVVRAWLAHIVDGAPRPARSPAPESSTRANGALPAGSSPVGEQATPVTLTDANFAQVVSGKLPVLVDFWAPWCGPCRMVAPSVEQLAREFDGRAVVGKLNVDENHTVTGRYNIMSIPTLLIFKNGAVVDQIVGAQPLEALRRRLARHA